MADHESWVSVDIGVKVAKTCEGPWCCYLYELNPQAPASGPLVAHPANKIQSVGNMTIVRWVLARCCQSVLSLLHMATLLTMVGKGREFRGCFWHSIFSYTIFMQLILGGSKWGTPWCKETQLIVVQGNFFTMICEHLRSAKCCIIFFGFLLKKGVFC